MTRRCLVIKLFNTHKWITVNRNHAKMKVNVSHNVLVSPTQRLLLLSSHPSPWLSHPITSQDSANTSKHTPTVSITLASPPAGLVARVFVFSIDLLHHMFMSVGLLKNPCFGCQMGALWGLVIQPFEALVWSGSWQFAVLLSTRTHTHSQAHSESKWFTALSAIS